jgi:hypothetical protein
MTQEERNDQEFQQEEDSLGEAPQVYSVKQGLGEWKFGRREFMAAAAAAAAAATVGGMVALNESGETISEMVDIAGDSVTLAVAMLALVAVEPGQPFSQVWRFTNDSASIRFKGASLHLLDGDPMQGPSSIAVPDIAPGETVAVRAEMVAPAEPGTYQSIWRLQPAGNVPPVAFSPFILQNGCIVESLHPYDKSETYLVINPDGTALRTRVRFSRVELDPGDYIVLKDSMDQEHQRITESAPSALWSESIPGKVVQVELITDSVGTAWGFCLDQIETAGRTFMPIVMKQPTPTPTATPTRTPTPTATPCVCYGVCSCDGHCSCNPYCTCDRVCTCDTIHYWYPN